MSKTEYYSNGNQYLRIGKELAVGVNTQLLVIEKCGIDAFLLADNRYVKSDSKEFNDALDEVKEKLKVK